MENKLKEEIESIKNKMGIKSTPKRVNEYGCVMLFFDFPEMDELHSHINKDDVYIDPNDDSYGLEDEPHITLLFGLHEEVTLEDVKDDIGDIVFRDCILHNASVFENEKYDVLKFDVRYVDRGGAFLSKANNNLKKFPYTSDFPDYHPHMTIGYLKPGKGKQYTQELKNKEYRITPQYGVYSQIDGTKDKFKIEVK